MKAKLIKNIVRVGKIGDVVDASEEWIARGLAVPLEDKKKKETKTKSKTKKKNK